jgi:peptidoglycan/LPS O-acetylase OafA/YrhL
MSRKFGLDIIRAVSIWLVLLQHLGLNPFGLKIGSIGVEIFFVLSGFLIGQILLNDLSRDLSFKSIRKFWIRRWFRILPLYYLILLLKFIFIDHSIGGKIIYYIFFLQNNFYGISYLNVSWSLVIEEWFYLFAPFFVLIALKIAGERKNLPVYFFIAFIVLENIARFAYVKLFNAPYDGVNGNVLLRFDSLFAGMLVAYLKINYISLFQKLSSAYILIAGLLLFCGYCFYISEISIPVNQLNKLVFPRTIGKILLSLIICLWIPSADKLQLSPVLTGFKKIVAAFITWTSLLTYSIYLIHTFVLERILKGVPVYSQTWLAKCALSVLIIYSLAYLLYRFFEKPVMSMREKFS